VKDKFQVVKFFFGESTHKIQHCESV